MQKNHKINDKYMISVPTNCLSCKLGCQATADFMRKLKEHNFNRACLAVFRHMFSECDVDLFGTSG